jgi:chromosome segregation protein
MSILVNDSLFNYWPFTSLIIIKMRLTHLKLAGFKSFVDSTTLHIHGQRVGVVGPNGCGKSNVMESVRWVLGESSAKEMRGDSMDAVIFNGAENRKPISRASVELIFDNSMGSAAGEWSQYAEISVKRVIERDKGSTYYINNSVVRRRDVADLFLGTGLGGRAYAIIGQNTINRIVEAKPEELRVFLEEAAGISKYKERRRETELRLRDTRENLTRVDDILRELEKQIVRLESQAVVAEQYRSMHELLSATNGQIWLLRKNEAKARWQDSQRLVETLVNELEAQMANLRANENALETARQIHISATDEMNQAQTQFYEMNAEVSSLEAQIKSIQNANERMKVQLQQFETQANKNAIQRNKMIDALAEAKEKQVASEQDYSETEQSIQSAKEALSIKTQTFHTELNTFNASLTTLNSAEQSLRIEQTTVQHLQKSLNEAQNQLTRLTQQLSEINIPDALSIATLENEVHDSQATLAELELTVNEAQINEQTLNQTIKQKRETQQEQQKHLHTLEAQIASLNKIQQSIRVGHQEGALAAWLKKENLGDKTRLWQTIRIQSGWENALEAALNGRLNAIVDVTMAHEDRPPNALTVVKASESVENNKHENFDNNRILSVIESIEAHLKPVICEFLVNGFIAQSAAEALTMSQSLSDGEYVVTQVGDIYTRNSVTYFGPQSALHGVLERQAELDRLTAMLPNAQADAQSTQAVIQALEAELSALKIATHAINQQLKVNTQNAHQLSLKLQQQQQQRQNAIIRKSTLEQDEVLAREKQAELAQELAIQEAKVDEISVQINQLRNQKQSHEVQKNAAELARNAARSALQVLENAYQEKNFNIKLTLNSIKELNEKLLYLSDEYENIQARMFELNEALNLSDVDVQLKEFEAAINKKASFEDALIAAKNHHSESESALQQLERDRIQNEQRLHPLRDQLEASRLSDQEMRLNYEQCEKALLTSTLSEAELVNQLNRLNDGRGHRPVTIKELDKKKEKLTEDIDALGAVNLAALEELKAEKIRHDLIVNQIQDLTEASETLENAIKKIDRETRGRLQATFEEANQHFAQIFSTLFNGGQARLELLGDEILDTGMQVFAQPPGKKNSTIHLLSGGEKALTAIALVFALFKLNPAPFCLMDEVDAPLDDSNTERFCSMVKQMSEKTQFLYVSHNKITMEMAHQLIGVTMQESGVSRIVDVDMEEAVRLVETFA